jgi:ribose transport system ATP-binding protein
MHGTSIGSRPVHALDGVPIEHMSEGETAPLPILSARGVTKSFPGVRALDAVDFDIRPGEVHALCGENGAGKSTLMRVLAGTFRADIGTITFKGNPIDFRGTREALGQGILLVHQEISLVPELTVAENIFLGNLPSRGAGIVWRRDLYRRARSILAEAGGEFEKIDPRAKVGTLSFARQQMVEIARAMAFNCTVVIFDEPTSSLTASEAVSLFETINRLKARGVGIVYISHKMPEIFALCDRITVLRDGQMRGTRITRDTNEDEITRLMIGRSLESYFERPAVTPGEELLRVEGLAVPGFVRGIDFAVRAGEVLGLYGLIGAGRSEAMEAIFGVRQKTAGKLFWKGAPIDIRNPREAVKLGIGLVPEDRKRQGLVLGMSAQDNTTLALMRRLGLFRLQDRAGERKVYDLFKQKLDIRAASPATEVGTLSGGNQQKIALAKWMAMDPRLLILDEPTRGIDVGAKAEIHSLVAKLAESGVAVILISSELPEILGLASRILTLREGRITASLDGRTATEESVMSALVMGGPG